MCTIHEILDRIREKRSTRSQYCTRCYEDDDAPPPQVAMVNYDKDTSNIGLNEEPDPLTARNATNTPVRVKQPEKQRNFLREAWGERQGKEPKPGEPRTSYDKKGLAVNPWAICHAATGPKKTDKYERCVQAVKSKSKIKKD